QGLDDGRRAERPAPSPLAPQGCRRGRVLCSAYPSAHLPRRYFRLGTATVLFNTGRLLSVIARFSTIFLPLGWQLSFGQLIDVVELLAIAFQQLSTTLCNCCIIPPCMVVFMANTLILLGY